MEAAKIPDLPEVQRQALDRAIVHQHSGRFFEAEMIYKQLMQRPSSVHPACAFMTGNFNLLTGDYAKAWPLFERRLEVDYYTRQALHAHEAPYWQGEALGDGTLLVVVDQGLGDTIMLARFLPWVAERAGRVILQVNDGTAPFWRHRFPDFQIGELRDPLPPCDAQVNLFSLPLLFGARPDTIPEPGYLQASSEDVAHWRARTAGDGFTVGLCWQGNPKHIRDFERSIPLKALEPVLRLPGFRFFGLQVVHGTEQVAALPDGLDFTDLGPEIMASEQPLEASAALVTCLDLIISVDSTLANLAGAMDEAVWIPAYKVPEWRWCMFPERVLDKPERAPWYRSQRLFTCRERGEWAAPVAAIADALLENSKAKL